MSSPQVPGESAPAPRRPRRWILVVVLLGLGGAGVAAWLATRDHGRKAALQDARAGRFAEAEPVLREALERNPDDIDVLDCLARGYTKADRPLDAEPCLSELVRLQPDNAEYLRLRWNLYRTLKRWEPAYADARRLLELTPGDEDLRRKTMGDAFVSGHFADAEDLCRSQLAQHPGDRKLTGMMAEIRRARGDDAEAGRILDELIRADPNDYAALQARGILYDETGHPDQAIPLLRRVFDEAPNRKRPAGYPLAVALEKVGQKDEAKKVLTEVRRQQDVELAGEAMKTQPDNLALHVQLAEDLLRAGHTNDGLAVLDQVLRRDPKFAPAHRALADYFERAGKPELAAEHRRLAGQSP
jgi:predicted Zn-dependent protease